MALREPQAALHGRVCPGCVLLNRDLLAPDRGSTQKIV